MELRILPEKLKLPEAHRNLTEKLIVGKIYQLNPREVRNGAQNLVGEAEAPRDSPKSHQKIDCKKDLSTEPEKGSQWSSKSCWRS